jgi:hypothetical protein
MTSRKEKTATAIAGIIVMLAVAVFWVSCITVAIHFIAKYW